MTDEGDEFAFANREIEIFDDGGRPLWCRINLSQIRNNQVVAHEPISIVSFLISRLRIGCLRGENQLRGTDKSSGSMSGSESVRGTLTFEREFELSRKSTTDRRISLKRGSWLMALRSRGRGMVTGILGPNIAHGPALNGMMRSDNKMPSSTSLVMRTTVFWSCSQMRWISSCKVARVRASRALSGSSRSRICGSIANARATETR